MGQRVGAPDAAIDCSAPGRVSSADCRAELEHSLLLTSHALVSQRDLIMGEVGAQATHLGFI